MRHNNMPGPVGGRQQQREDKPTRETTTELARTDRKRKLQSEKQKNGREARVCVWTVRDNRAVLRPHVP